MCKYLFKTEATMKEYNNKKWWIDGGIVRETIIEADSLFIAIEEYRKEVKKEYYIEISDNALKNKTPMYIDTKEGVKQVGYVITGKTDFEDSNSYKWTSQYIDLWVNIQEVKEVEF